MIPPIRIQLLAGPQAGLQTTHTESRVSFGREAGNTVVLDDQHLSRRHGELVCVDGHWAVVNLSPNGTSVNGRPVKGTDPRPLKPGDVVGVGKMKLFAVQFQPGGGPAPAGDADAAGAQAIDAGNRMSRRGKLWTAIGGYIAVMLVVFVVLMMLGGDGKEGGGAMPEQVPDAQIIAEIRKPIEKSRDERSAREHLELAQSGYPSVENSAGGLFNVHKNYKLALAYSGERKFDGLDQLRYVEVEQRLIEKITRDYGQAYVKATNREWKAAEEAMFDLIAAYPADKDSAVYKHFDELLSYVRAHTRRR